MKHEFDAPMNTNNNGMSSMGGLPMEMSIPSLFDPLPSHHNNSQIKKEMVKSESQDAFGLTDKKPPLNVIDQKPSMPGFVPGQTGFKVKPDVKNASSWSSLAKANSPQGNSAANSSKQQVSIRLLLFIISKSIRGIMFTYFWQ